MDRDQEVGVGGNREVDGVADHVLPHGDRHGSAAGERGGDASDPAAFGLMGLPHSCNATVTASSWSGALPSRVRDADAGGAAADAGVYDVADRGAGQGGAVPAGGGLRRGAGPAGLVVVVGGERGGPRMGARGWWYERQNGHQDGEDGEP